MAVRRALILLTVAVLFLGGLAAVGVGIAQRTVWLPDDEVTVTAPLPADVPVAVTEPGVLEMRAGPVAITVTAADPGSPAVLAMGRQDDVMAWVDGAGHALIGGHATERRLRVETVDGEPEVPDPAGSDLWVSQETGTGGASFVYDPPDGRWLVLAAGSGSAPGPAEMAITWPREVTTPWSTPLIVGGVLLVSAALGLLVLTWYRGDLARYRRHRQADSGEAS